MRKDETMPTRCCMYVFISVNAIVDEEEKKNILKRSRTPLKKGFRFFFRAHKYWSHHTVITPPLTARRPIQWARVVNHNPYRQSKPWKGRKKKKRNRNPGKQEQSTLVNLHTVYVYMYTRGIHTLTIYIHSSNSSAHSYAPKHYAYAK
jgi:hypothetical protein